MLYVICYMLYILRTYTYCIWGEGGVNPAISYPSVYLSQAAAATALARPGDAPLTREGWLAGWAWPQPQNGIVYVFLQSPSLLKL